MLILAGGFLAFPSTRVLANRCVDACVAGTDTVSRLLGIKSRVSVVSAVPGDRSMAPDFELPDSNGN
jgi:hypothetical protein